MNNLVLKEKIMGKRGETKTSFTFLDRLSSNAINWLHT